VTSPALVLSITPPEMVKAPVPMAELAALEPPLLMFNWPARSVVPPLKVFSPESVSELLPLLLRAPPPPMVYVPSEAMVYAVVLLSTLIPPGVTAAVTVTVCGPATASLNNTASLFVYVLAGVLFSALPAQTVDVKSQFAPGEVAFQMSTTPVML